MGRQLGVRSENDVEVHAQGWGLLQLKKSLQLEQLLRTVKVLKTVELLDFQ